MVLELEGRESPVSLANPLLGVAGLDSLASGTPAAAWGYAPAGMVFPAAATPSPVALPMPTPPAPVAPPEALSAESVSPSLAPGYFFASLSTDLIPGLSGNPMAAPAPAPAAHSAMPAMPVAPSPAAAATGGGTPMGPAVTTSATPAPATTSGGGMQPPMSNSLASAMASQGGDMRLSSGSDPSAYTPPPGVTLVSGPDASGEMDFSGPGWIEVFSGNPAGLSQLTYPAAYSLALGHELHEARQDWAVLFRGTGSSTGGNSPGGATTGYSSGGSTAGYSSDGSTTGYSSGGSTTGYSSGGYSSSGSPTGYSSGGYTPGGYSSGLYSSGGTTMGYSSGGYSSGGYSSGYSTGSSTTGYSSGSMTMGYSSGSSTTGYSSGGYSSSGYSSGGSTTGYASGGYSSGGSSTTGYSSGGYSSSGSSSGSNMMGSGSADVPSFTWSSHPVFQPALVNFGDRGNVEGNAVSAYFYATDPSGYPVTYAAENLPAGLSIDPNTGVISGTVGPQAAENFGGVYAVTLIASNGHGGVGQELVNWTVSPAPTPPTPSSPGDPAGPSAPADPSGAAPPSAGLLAIGAVADQTGQEGQSVSLALAISDGPGATPTETVDGLPPGLTFDPATNTVTGTISPGAAAQGPFAVTVTASDGANPATQEFAWNVNPVVTVAPVADQTSTEGGVVSLPVHASESGATLTYTAAGLPSGLSIDPGGGVISGTVAAGASLQGPFGVTVTASDGTYSTSQELAWTVLPAVAPAAPALTAPAPRTNHPGDVVNVQVVASDAAGYALTYAATGLPDGLSIDPNTGQISGTVAEDAVSATPSAVTVTADDGVGEVSSRTFAWAVGASPVGLTAAPVQAVEGQDTGTVTVGTFRTADVLSTADEYTATVSWGDGTTGQGSVSGGNGSFVVTDGHTFAAAGVYPVGLTVTAADGTTTTSTATATVAGAAQTLEGGFQDGELLYQGGSGPLQVGLLRDSNPAVNGADFSVLIDPGDGTGPMIGGLTGLGAGECKVELAHAYQHVGNYTVTVTATGPHGVRETTTSTVEIGDLLAGDVGTLTVGTFSTGNPMASAGDYSAAITWGDGSTGVGTVSVSYGQLTVKGDHTYAVDSIDLPGAAYPVGVTVTGPGGQTFAASHGVEVTRPHETGVGENVLAAAGMAFAGAEIATFSDPDPTDGAGEFAATVDWGDGSAPDSNVQVVGAAGVFHLLGSHLYATPGEYTTQIEVSQDWGAAIKCKPLIGMVQVAGGAVNIDGPEVVPGNSKYLYNAYETGPGDGLNPDNARGRFFINNVPVGTGSMNPVAGVASVESGKYWRINSEGVNKVVGYFLTLTFTNVPAALNIKLTNAYPGSVASLTKAVYVVEVKIAPPPTARPPLRLRDGSIVSEFPANLAFRKGTATSTKAGQASYEINGVIVRSLPSLQFRSASDRAAGVASVPVGFEARTSVTLLGPTVGGTPNYGVSHIKVGFNQYELTETMQAAYGGALLVGQSTRAGRPVYDALATTEEFFGESQTPVNPDDTFRNASASNNSKIISMNDTPKVVFPDEYDAGAGTNPRSDVLVFKIYTLYVAAASDCAPALSPSPTAAAPAQYWDESAATWSYSINSGTPAGGKVEIPAAWATPAAGSPKPLLHDGSITATFNKPRPRYYTKML